MQKLKQKELTKGVCGYVSEPNTLDGLELNQALKIAKKHTKQGNYNKAKKIYENILTKFSNNKKAKQALAALNKPEQFAANQIPPQDIINKLLKLYSKGQLSATVDMAQALNKQYPKAFIVWNVLGAAQQGLGEVFEASKAFKNVTIINPNYAIGFNNLGVVLKEQGKLEEAIEAYKKAVSLKPDFADAFNNLGNAFREK